MGIFATVDYNGREENREKIDNAFKIKVRSNPL
jgi:hypothetical protein